MSDFFAGVYGAKFPEVVMNSGPLPPANGLPAPLHDTADARINYNSTLLGNLEPYAYGEPGYLSSQVSYVNQPHRMQKLVPVLRLPTPQVNSQHSFELSHPIDDSDIAFVMRLDRASTICTSLSSRAVNRQFSSVMDPFVNICTLNYLLAGLQLCYVPTHPDKSKWFDLLHDLDQDAFPEVGHRLSLHDLRHIVRDLIRPFGVVRGSERQGGQDETGNSPATWPVNFVANLVLDGKERNVVNIWHYHDISAGDDLVLRLKPMRIPQEGHGYTLNHYYKKFVQQNFQSVNQVMPNPPTHVWQLVPDVFHLEHEPDPLPAGARLPPGLGLPQGYCWQEFGFWHIGRSQVMFRKYAEQEYYFNDMANQLKINHLDMTFEPTWTKVPGEEAEGPRAIPGTYPAAAGFLAPGAPPPPFPPPDRFAGEGVAPGMRALFGEPAGKRGRWAPELGLELMERALGAPMPSLRGGAPAQQSSAAAAAVVSDLFARPAPRSVADLFARPGPGPGPPTPPLDGEPPPVAPEAAPAPDPMDIGVLEEPPPVARRAGAGGFDAILSQQGAARRKPAARKAAPAPAPAPDF